MPVAVTRRITGYTRDGGRIYETDEEKKARLNTVTDNPAPSLSDQVSPRLASQMQPQLGDQMRPRLAGQMMPSGDRNQLIQQGTAAALNSPFTPLGFAAVAQNAKGTMQPKLTAGLTMDKSLSNVNDGGLFAEGSPSDGYSQDNGRFASAGQFGYGTRRSNFSLRSPFMMRLNLPY